MATVLAPSPREWYRRDCRAEGLSAVTPPDSGDAVPADGPAYGVNNSTFQRLWSDDVDNGNLGRRFRRRQRLIARRIRASTRPLDRCPVRSPTTGYVELE